MSAPGV